MGENIQVGKSSTVQEYEHREKSRGLWNCAREVLNGVLRVGGQRKKGIVAIYSFLCCKNVVNTFGRKSISTFLIYP